MKCERVRIVKPRAPVSGNTRDESRMSDLENLSNIVGRVKTEFGRPDKHMYDAATRNISLLGLFQCKFSVRTFEGITAVHATDLLALVFDVATRDGQTETKQTEH